MHRTQIMLDDWQYEKLKSASRREGRSISSLVREAVTRYLDRGSRASKLKLAEIAGIGKDTGTRGKEHDDIIYGRRRKDR